MGKFQCVPRSQIVISDSTRHNTCVRGMQETLLTLTDHPSEASAWPHLGSVLCLLCPLMTCDTLGCGHHHIVTSDTSRVTHSYLDRGKIEKVRAE